MSIVTPDQAAPLTDPVTPTTTPVKGARRTQVLAWLRATDAERTAAEAAQELDLHLNTARFHLDALVDAGHALRHSEERATPGRPRILYSAQRADPALRSYRLLSGMLVGLVESLGGDGPAAERAGRTWGRHLVAGDPPTGRDDEGASLGRLEELMGRIGFHPETRSGAGPDGPLEMHLHHCPFIEVVGDHQDVICALHRGLMRGALEDLDTSLRVESLEPFATPGTCRARLARPQETTPPRRSA